MTLPAGAGDGGHGEGPGAKAARSRLSPVGIGVLLALVATLIWSGNFISARFLGDEVPPVQTAFFRWLIALVVIAPFALGQVQRQRALIRAHLGRLALAGLFGVTLFNTLIYLAARTTPATNLAMIAAAAPVLMVLFARQRLRVGQAAGLVLALFGVLALISGGSPSALLGLDLSSGDLLMLVAMATFAGYSVLLRGGVGELTPVTVLFSTVVIGLVLLVPCYVVSLVVEGGFQPTASTTGTLLYIGVLSSAVAFFAWNRALALAGPDRSGAIYYLQPLLVALLSFALLGETFTSGQLLAMVPLLAGVVLGTRR